MSVVIFFPVTMLLPMHILEQASVGHAMCSCLEVTCCILLSYRDLDCCSLCKV